VNRLTLSRHLARTGSRARRRWASPGPDGQGRAATGMPRCERGGETTTRRSGTPGSTSADRAGTSSGCRAWHGLCAFGTRG